MRTMLDYRCAFINTIAGAALSRFLSLLVCVVVVGASLVGASAATAAPPSRDSYVVVYKPRVPSGDAAEVKTDSLERREGFRSTQRYRAAVRGFAAQLNPTAVRALRADPDVAYVVRDTAVSAVPSNPDLKVGEAIPTSVARVFGTFHGRANPTSKAAVALLDTGIQTGNPDLPVRSGKNCVTGRGATADDEGHGTHVAGVISAKNNGKGVVGVAPGTPLVAVKVLDANGDGTLSTVICGLEWVAANAARYKIKVVNLSLGAPGGTDGNCGADNADPMHQSVCNVTRQGVVVVAAAGNSGTDLASQRPAAYPEVLTVTAMSDSDGTRGGVGGPPSCAPQEADDTYARYSNYATSPSAANHVIAAPGTCVVSTYPRNRFAVLTGTSMASPIVAAVVALCIDQGGRPGPCAGMTPGQAIQKIRDVAATRPADYGFVGDPNRPVGGRYYGNLVLGFAGA